MDNHDFTDKFDYILYRAIFFAMTPSAGDFNESDIRKVLDVSRRVFMSERKKRVDPEVDSIILSLLAERISNKAPSMGDIESLFRFAAEIYKALLSDKDSRQSRAQRAHVATAVQGQAPIYENDPK